MGTMLPQTGSKMERVGADIDIDILYRAPLSGANNTLFIRAVHQSRIYPLMGKVSVIKLYVGYC